MRSLLSAMALILIAGAGLAGLAAAEQTSGAAPHLPVSFSSEDDTFPGAVPVPECALHWLARDAHISRQLDHGHLSIGQLPADSFVAAEVDLGTDGKLLVVMGNHGFRGANISPFWILRWTPPSCDLLLDIAAHHLAFLETKTHGLPDVQIGYASTGNISEHQFKFDGAEYKYEDDACRPAEAERADSIPGERPKMYLFQPPGHSRENTLCEARAWLWKQWQLKKGFDLEVRLFSKEGDQTTMSYGAAMANGRLTISILVHREVFDDDATPGASHRTVENKLILAVGVERRLARRSGQDRAEVVSAGDSPAPDTYELHFIDETGKDVAVL